MSIRREMRLSSRTQVGYPPICPRSRGVSAVVELVRPFVEPRLQLGAHFGRPSAVSDFFIDDGTALVCLIRHRRTVEAVGEPKWPEVGGRPGWQSERQPFTVTLHAESTPIDPVRP